MEAKTTYGTDWSNIDLSNNYERNLNILEPYSFDTLILEVNCNIKDTEINRETIRKQFMESLQSKMNCAMEVFNDNLDNIVEHIKNDSDE
jgi:hypothetical protein